MVDFFTCLMRHGMHEPNQGEPKKSAFWHIQRPISRASLVPTRKQTIARAIGPKILTFIVILVRFSTC